MYLPKKKKKKGTLICIDQWRSSKPVLVFRVYFERAFSSLNLVGKKKSDFVKNCVKNNK